MAERLLAKRVLNELRALRNAEPFQPTADIDIVWVFSGPGTVKSPPEKGPYARIYAGHLPDRDLIYAGVDMVKKITSIRKSKEETLITKDDISESGPIFYYNGENLSHPNANFAQNEDLRQLLASGDFPLPASNVEIHDLSEINTPGQIYQFAHFLSSRRDIKKVAMISTGPHMRRILRYLNQHKSLFPQEVILIPAPIRETIAPVGRTIGEIRRIERYAKKGYLTEDPLA